MTTKIHMEEYEIEEPIGSFIINNLPFEKRFQTAHGLYVHYSDVCNLLNKYDAERKITELKTIEVAELSQIKVNAKIGSTLFVVYNECIWLANMLKCAVQLYWNGKYIDIYTNTTFEQVASKI